MGLFDDVNTKNYLRNFKKVPDGMLMSKNIDNAPLKLKKFRK